jgi:SAM-dependent methyltransferase
MQSQKPPDYRAEYSGAAYFASRLPYDPAREVLWPVLCRYLERDIPRQAAVLELGGGYCHFINNIRASRKDVVDLAPFLAQYAGKDVRAHVRSCTDLDSFDPESFDIVFASNLFEHLTREELDRTLTGIHRVLRVGGKLMVIQPNFKHCYKHYFDDYTHVQIFTHVGLADLLRTRGLTPEKVIARFLPFSLKKSGPKWPWLLTFYLRSPFKPMAAQMYILARKDRRDDGGQ